MASITIRNLDDDLKSRLCMRVVGNGHSMEEQARLILRTAVSRAGESGRFHPRVLRALRRRGTQTATARADARTATVRLRWRQCRSLTRMCCPS